MFTDKDLGGEMSAEENGESGDEEEYIVEKIIDKRRTETVTPRHTIQSLTLSRVISNTL